MSSTDEPARDPAENNAGDARQAVIEDKNTPTPTDATPTDTSTPAPAPQSPAPVRLAESQLEATHADLPPLSNIPGATSGTTGSGDASGAHEARPATRRGLGRGGAAGASSAARADIGVVEDPAAISETLSGQFANGYSERPERAERQERPRRERARFDAPSAPAEGAAETPPADGPATPSEFVPPVSEKIYKAEMDPERERKFREDRRRDRPERGGRRDDRNARDDRFSRDDRPRDWAPREGGQGDGTAPPARVGGRQKLIIEPVKIPEQEPEEGLFSRIKSFFAKLFGGGSDASETSAPKGGDGNRRPRDDNYRGRNGGHRRGGHGRHNNDRSRGDFRHDNSRFGGSSQGGYGRDRDRNRHSQGGGPRHGGGEG